MFGWMDRGRTFAAQIAQRRSAVPLHFDALALSKRDQHIKHAQTQQMRLQVIRQSKHRYRRRHLALHAQWHLEHQLLALLHGAGLEHQLLVLIRRRGQIP